MPFLQPSPESVSGQGSQPLAVPQGQAGLDGRQNASPTNTTREIPTYLELIYNDSPPSAIADGYEIPRAFPNRDANNKTSSTSDTVERPRTFSTSSTVSNGSASTPVMYQQAHLVRNTTDNSDSAGKVGSILVIGNMKANGCIGGIRKNAPEFIRNGEKDLSSLEKLLPSVKKCTNNHQTVGGSAMDNKGGVNTNIKTNSAYSNVAKQPLLEEEVKETLPESSHNCSNDNNEPTVTISHNCTPTRTLS